MIVNIQKDYPIGKVNMGCEEKTVGNNSYTQWLGFRLK